MLCCLVAFIRKFAYYDGLVAFCCWRTKRAQQRYTLQSTTKGV